MSQGQDQLEVLAGCWKLGLREEFVIQRKAWGGAPDEEQYGTEPREAGQRAIGTESTLCDLLAVEMFYRHRGYSDPMAENPRTYASVSLVY